MRLCIRYLLVVATASFQFRSATWADPGDLKLEEIGGGEFQLVGQGVSINDRGTVAFMAQANGKDNIYVSNRGVPRPLLNKALTLPRYGDAPRQEFGEWVQINERGDVLAWRRLDAIVHIFNLAFFVPILSDALEAPITYIELYPESGRAGDQFGVPRRLLSMNGHLLGGEPIRSLRNGLPFALIPFRPNFYFFNPVWAGEIPFEFDTRYPFTGVLRNISFNNRSQATFSAFDGDGEYLANERSRKSSVIRERPLSLTADSGRFVFSSSSGGQVYLGNQLNMSFSPLVSGFNRASQVGISDDGEVVVFAANRIGTGDSMDPLGAGMGVFAVLPNRGNHVVKLAGLSGDGFLDPGETWVDENTNGLVDAGEDQGDVAGISRETRVCVNRAGEGFKDSQYAVAFVGDDDRGRTTLFYSFVNSDNESHLSSFPPEAIYRTRGNAIQLHDGVNNRGELAFRVGTGQRGRVIRAVRERPEVKVVNVLTHGFRPSFDDPETFVQRFEQIKNEFRSMPQPGSVFEGAVESYVARWESTEGFQEALIATTVREVVKIVRPAFRQTHPAIYAALDTIHVASDVIQDSFLQTSGKHARLAARSIVRELHELDYLSGDPQRSWANNEIIHLVGHSRGAGVNALVAQHLVGLGYQLDQYTALDGYGTDWPGLSGQLGDVDIAVAVPARGVKNRLNYRVEDDFWEFAIDSAIQGLIDAMRAIGLSPAGLDAIEDVALNNPTIEMLKDELFRWKAPTRSGFLDLTMAGDAPTGPSNHLNIVQIYEESGTRPTADHQYIRHNTLGRRSESTEGAAPRLGLVRHRAGEPGTDGLSGFEARSDTIILGQFDSIGATCFQLAELDLAEAELDDVVKAWISLVQEPEYLVRAAWHPTAAVDFFERTEGNVALKMMENGTIHQEFWVPTSDCALGFWNNLAASEESGTLVVRVAGELLVELSGDDVPPFVVAPLSRYRDEMVTLEMEWTSVSGGSVLLDDIALYEIPRLALQRSSDERQITLVWTASLPGQYRIQHSPDMVTWSDLHSETVDTPEASPSSIPVVFDDERQFYRLNWQ